MFGKIKLWYVQRYNLLGKRRHDPRRDVLRMFRHDLFLKPGYTEYDYRALPDPERNTLIDFSEEHWLAYCMWTISIYLKCWT